MRITILFGGNPPMLYMPQVPHGNTHDS